MMRSMGYDHVLDYTVANYTKNGEHYDLILDNVARHSVFDYKRSLSPGGHFVVVGGSVPTILSAITLGSLISKFEKGKSGKKIGILIHRPNRKDLDFLSELYESGKLKPVIDRVYPHAETAEAFRYYGEGNFKGKVVITI